MKTTTINFYDIVPNNYNPRVMSQENEEKLRKNLQEFGLVDPIIINLKNNHIIGGHQRYNILKQEYDQLDKEPILTLIQLGNIGWAFIDEDLNIKDDTHEKALNLALNKIRGDWDYPKLDTLLEEIELTHFNMELTGFVDMKSLDDMESLDTSTNNIADDYTEDVTNDNIKNQPNSSYKEENNQKHVKKDNNKEHDNNDEDDDVIYHYTCPKCGHKFN